MKEYYVYILSNYTRTVLYIGVTNSLDRRVVEHIVKVDPASFASRYNTKHLVYYEHFLSRNDAIRREKQLKNWGREKKMLLIKKQNPTVKDLLED